MAAPAGGYRRVAASGRWSGGACTRSVSASGQRSAKSLTAPVLSCASVSVHFAELAYEERSVMRVLGPLARLIGAVWMIALALFGLGGRDVLL